MNSEKRSRSSFKKERSTENRINMAGDGDGWRWYGTRFGKPLYTHKDGPHLKIFVSSKNFHF
jgi:hypothetical protein